jgi:hypothetical protein
MAHPPPRSLPKRERLLVVMGLGLLHLVDGAALVRLIGHFGRRRERAAAAAAAAAEWPRLRPGRSAW